MFLRNVTGADDVVLTKVQTHPVNVSIFHAGPQMLRFISMRKSLHCSEALKQHMTTNMYSCPFSRRQTHKPHTDTDLFECIKSGFFLLFHRHNVTTVTYTECMYEKTHIILHFCVIISALAHSTRL